MWARKNKDVCEPVMSGRESVLLWAAAAGDPGVSWLGRDDVPWSCRTERLPAGRDSGMPLVLQPWVTWLEILDWGCQERHSPVQVLSFIWSWRPLSLWVVGRNTMRCIPYGSANATLEGSICQSLRWPQRGQVLHHSKQAPLWPPFCISSCLPVGEPGRCQQPRGGPEWEDTLLTQTPQLMTETVLFLCIVASLSLSQRQVEKDQQATVNPGLSSWIVLISGRLTNTDCSVDRELGGDQRSLLLSLVSPLVGVNATSSETATLKRFKTRCPSFDDY